MSRAEAILSMLVREGIMLTRQIAVRLELRNDQIRDCCRYLKSQGLICSINGVHEISVKGREVLASGKIKHMRKGCGHGGANHGKSLRQRAWYHMRAQSTFNLEYLLGLVADETTNNIKENITKYCNALYKVGILKKTGRTRDYYLVEDTGTLCPSWNKQEKCITDRNTGEIRFINQTEVNNEERE